jgi:uncharacterized Zn finger protein (UPF0148 family)
MLPSICPRCGTLNQVAKSGMTVNCAFCPISYTDGETPRDYEEQVRRLELKEFEDAENLAKEKQVLEKKAMKELQKHLKDTKRRMKTDPHVRATEYLEHLRKGGFPSKAGLSNNAHIYVLKLNKPEGLYWKQHRFPNDEFPVLVDPDSKECKGFVYVGHTQRVPNQHVDLKQHNGDPILYRFYDEHISGADKKSPVVTHHHFSKDFETCGRKLTERFGFRNVSTTKPTQGEVESYKLESWVGYMLYKLGYWVWGPHAHHADRKEEFGDFLGKGIYL